ncbi:AzlD domain-containing protein [Undibacterium sp. FT79W]|uniref:AzlD domain-containing protein n=1 Tax=Undibacterium sp. FT79W TaxID=2762296 RepID=UPI00164BC646|nr:AzlD domain-containing protein [Undibacterium sp. FT79W]MBC3879640.1 AzlD domain-containing protein [Undibacterium sp. FT79W]
MSAADIWRVIFLLFLATFIARSSFWLAGNRIQLPKRVQEALRYAPACALAAIIVPDLLLTNAQLDVSWHNPRLIAGVLATVFFLIRKDMLQTIIFGMLVFTLARLYM